MQGNFGKFLSKFKVKNLPSQPIEIFKVTNLYVKIFLLAEKEFRQNLRNFDTINVKLTLKILQYFFKFGDFQNLK